MRLMTTLWSGRTCRGVNRDDLEVTVTDNSLTIKGESKHEHEIESGNVFRRERFSGQFMRTLPLSVGIKADQAKASFNHGVLEIRHAQD